MTGVCPKRSVAYFSYTRMCDSSRVMNNSMAHLHNNVEMPTLKQLEKLFEILCENEQHDDVNAHHYI
jgi:hypothetical protein